MTTLTFNQLIAFLLKQCDEFGISDQKSRAWAIAQAIKEAGALSTQAVWRKVEHTFFGTENGDDQITRFDGSGLARTAVQMGDVLIDPVLGVVDSARILEAEHRNAIHDLGPRETGVTSHWGGSWVDLEVDLERASPIAWPPLSTSFPDGRHLVREAAKISDESVAWRKAMEQKIAWATGTSENRNVGTCLAVMAGLATHLVVEEQLPVRSERIVDVHELQSIGSSTLVRRGARIVSEVLADPLFETMDLPAGRTESIHTWRNPARARFPTGKECIPLSSIQTWKDHSQAFEELANAIARKHHRLFDMETLTKPPRPRL